MRTIRIGSRDSKLAVAQSEIFLNQLKRIRPEYEYALITMKTAGDMILDKPLEQIGGKGLFIKELDKALLENRIDLAVHSLKDMPAQITEGLCIRVYGKREDPRDALVLPADRASPDMTKPIGCMSKRRRIQLRRLYPDWSAADIRGNILTRLEKLDQGAYGALVLAAAGLKRLNLAHRIYRFFEPEELLPSAGQGTLVITARAGDGGYLDRLDDPESRCRSLAERALVKNLGGDCGAPIAAYAALAGNRLTLTGFFCPDEQGPSVSGSLAGPPETAEALGRDLALQLLGNYHRETGSRGKVWLVGAGPGDAGLLTLKGDRVLKEASAVCYDHLIGKGVLARISPSAELLYVGKRAGGHAVPQEEINRLLVQKAALGKQVVRLKGGDPFLFGRGGEELEQLKTAGIPFEAVPGVSSALAGPALAGIPVSHRDYCSQVHLITGHSREANPRSIDYKALVQSGGTYIFLMGVAGVEPICRGLLDAGLSPDTPGALIERATTAGQRTITAPLARLAETAKSAGAGTPGLIVIGGVCGLSEKLSWAESLPLAGVSVGVTGLERAESRLCGLLSAEGAEAIPIPTIRIAPIADTPELETALAGLTGREWLAFTSPAGVEVFFGKLKAYRRDVRTLAGVKFAAVGKATASALEARGVFVDVLPGRFGGAELGAELAKAARPGERVILPRSSAAGEDILRVLSEAGVETAAIAIYDTLPLDRYRDSAYRELLLERLDWLAFTSSSGVEGFAGAFGPSALKNRKALCIGDQTAQAAARYGMEICAAKNATLESMTETFKDFLK